MIDEVVATWMEELCWQMVNKNIGHIHPKEVLHVKLNEARKENTFFEEEE